MNTKTSKSMNANGNLPKIIFLIIVLLFAFHFLKKDIVTPVKAQNYIWNVRSIDTMKTSRDMALAKLNDDSYITDINKQIDLIKSLGANYVAIDTPYDNQFKSYLLEWVNAARNADLHVWFRGSFSNYEGWFNYPKNLSPDALLQKTQDFIVNNPNLFQDGDIFDPCPECENGGFWSQPQANDDYNQFVVKKNNILKTSFQKINKNVIYNWNSIIGGRAKDVLNKNTIDSLGDVVALDHYVADPQNYTDYINYFADNFGANTVFSEFGAPIPSIHGNMTQNEQADFIDRVLNNLYENKDHVLGLNYWVLSAGTTALYNSDYSPKPVVSVIQNYFQPGIINGKITNTFGNPINNATVSTSDGKNSTSTNENGEYQLVIPANTNFTLTISNSDYLSQNHDEIGIKNSSSESADFTLEPVKNDIIYNLQNYFFKIF